MAFEEGPENSRVSVRRKFYHDALRKKNLIVHVIPNEVRKCGWLLNIRKRAVYADNNFNSSK